MERKPSTSVHLCPKDTSKRKYHSNEHAPANQIAQQRTTVPQQNPNRFYQKTDTVLPML